VALHAHEAARADDDERYGGVRCDDEVVDLADFFAVLVVDDLAQDLPMKERFMRSFLRWWLDAAVSRPGCSRCICLAGRTVCIPLSMAGERCITRGSSA